MPNRMKQKSIRDEDGNIVVIDVEVSDAEQAEIEAREAEWAAGASARAAARDMEAELEARAQALVAHWDDILAAIEATSGASVANAIRATRAARKQETLG